MQTLNGRRILIGISGSIAAYKMAETVRLLKKAGATVQVLMTPDATRFITPLTLGTLAESEVLTDVFPNNTDGSWTKHIHLGLNADLFLIAPATAQTIAKLANGFCDSMLTATALAARCPILVAPAMDHDMFVHPATQENLTRLRRFGYTIIEPEHGELASGLVGKGRLPEPVALLDAVTQFLHPVQPLRGKNVVITAGPTREALDPVRYLTNHSTGTMGYEMAKAAQNMGAKVTLISGPVSLPKPDGVTVVDVITADDMLKAAQTYAPAAHLMIAAAAVADYAPATVSDVKMKKKDDALSIPLRKTPDVLWHLGQQKPAHQCLVGFALETHDALAHAQSKLARKNLDYIVLNDLGIVGAGFGTTTNQVTILGRDGSRFDLSLAPKPQIARGILSYLAEHLAE